MPAPYSAGSVYLQVVPSFAGVQDTIGEEAEKYGRLFGRKFDEGFGKETKDNLGKHVADGLKGAEDEAGKSGKRAGKAYSENLGREAGRNVGREVSKALNQSERESERSGARAGGRYAGKFNDTIRKALAQAQREIDTIKVDADVDPALAAMAQVRAAMAALRDAKIGVDLDAGDAVQSIAVLESLLDVMQRNAADIKVRVNAAQAMQELATVRAMVEQLDKMEVDPEVKADRQLGSFESLLKSKIAAALQDLPPMDLQADDSEVNRKIAAIRQELFALVDAEIDVDISTDEAMIRLRVLMKELEELDSETADVKIRVDAGKAYAELLAVMALVQKLEADDVEVDVKVDDHGSMGRTSRESSNSADAFRIFNMRVLGLLTLGPALVPVLGGIAGGLAAVGTFAGVGAAALGVAALGLSGISDAVTALNDVEKNAAKDQAAAAKTMRSARNAVRDAQLSLTRAQRDAGEVAEQSGRQIEAAQRREEDARAAVESALRRQTQAEERLRDAQAESLKAQRDLIDARDEAEDQLQDLAMKAKGGAIAERAAALELAKAHAAYITTFQDGGSTNVEREEAGINYERAKFALEELQVENGRLAEQQAEAAKTGVEGTDTYQRALEKVASANDQVESAQDGVADATRGVADAQQDVIDAQRGVADAQRDAIRAQRDATEAVEDAARRASDAQVALQEAIYETQVLGSASQQKLAEAMGALGPAGREFAIYWHSLKDDFREMRDIVQEGFLPGLQTGIENFLASSGPALKDYLGATGQALGDLAARAGSAFDSPESQRFFDRMTEYTPILLDQFGSIFGNIIGGIRNVMDAMFPFTEDFGNGLIDVTEQWEQWTSGFNDPNSGFQKFLDWLRENGPDIWDFFVSLGEAIWDLGVAIEPYASVVLDIVDGLLDMIGGMDPDLLGAIVIGIIGLMVAFQIASGVLAAFNAVLTLIWLNPVGATIFAIVAAIFILGAAIFILWQNSETFRNVMTAIWNGIKAAVEFVVTWFQTSVVPVLQAVWDGIAAGAKWLWENILQPIFSVWQVAWGVLWDFLVAMWDNFGKPMFDLIMSIFGELWDIAEPILTLIGMAFGLLWDLIKIGWEYVGKPIFDAFISVVTWLWEHVIDPVLQFIAGAFGWLFGIIESAWNATGKPVLDLFQAIVEGLVGVFQGSFDGIKGIWDALLDVLMTPIVFVVETVLNKGLIAGINGIASIFTDDDTWIDPLPTDWIPGRAYGGSIPGRADGGRIPGTSAHMRADDVLIRATAGEFMHDVPATQYYGLGLMEALNNREIPREALLAGLQGRANGGMIDPIWEAFHKQFPDARKTSDYRAGDSGLHGKRQAVDIAGRRPYPDPQGKADMLRINQWAAAAFPNLSQLIHTAPGAINLLDGKRHQYNAKTVAEHKDHVHVGAKSMANLAGGSGEPSDGGTSWWDTLTSFISSPFDTLKGIITEFAGDSLNSDMGQMLLNIPTEFARNSVDAILDVVGGIGDAIGGAVDWGLDLIGLGDDDNVALSKNIGVQDQVKRVAAGYGWDSGAQWAALVKLVEGESGWNPNAANPSSSARGLFQKMTSINGPVEKTAAGQAQWGLGYISDRYGSPVEAYAKWLSRSPHWYANGGLVGGMDAIEAYANGGWVEDHATLYDDGGYLPPGLSMVLNDTGAPEPVLTAAELEALRTRGDGGDGPLVGEYHSHMMNGPTAGEVAGEFLHTVTVIRRGGKYE